MSAAIPAAEVPAEPSAAPAPAPSAAPAKPAGMRERILDAAMGLFYANGIGATSADRIIEQVGITKVTFYRHFRTKADLVVAYLRRQAAGEEEAFGAVRGVEPREALRALAVGIGDWSCRPGFRGCPFINASAEFPDAEHPVRAVIDAHRAWLIDLFAGIAADAGAADPEETGKALMMLRDGAMVTGYLGDPQSVGETLHRAFLAVLPRPA